MRWWNCLNFENVLVKMMKKIKWTQNHVYRCLNFSFIFFQVIISFFSVAKPFLQGVEFSNPDLQAFETFFFRFELWQETDSIAESHLQGFKTGQQWNTLLEQCQIWNYANALVKLFELWKCVGENDEEDKIEHKIMFTDVWILVLFFFRL